MTEKQEMILNAALELFAGEGFAATSTSKIAKRAGVSEGLIFRHFESKQGLLDALISMAETKLGEMYGPVIMETDPRKVIRKTIQAPFRIDEKEYNFWRLQFMLKWQKEYNHPDKMKPLLDKLTGAFEELGYEKPENEARQLNYVIESMSMGTLRGDNTVEDAKKFGDFLIKKYEV